MNEYPYWWTTVDSAFHASPSTAGPLPAKPIDVAIVGAGYTGLSAARRLAKAGASVVVLDREHVGAGASSRNGGQVLTGMRLDPASLVASYGETTARVLFDAASTAIDHLERLIEDEAIACDYERTGHVQLAAKPRHFRALADEQSLLARVFDHRVELVSRADQHREIGSTRYHGLLVDPRSGALNPARYVRGLAAAAARAGACLAERTAVRTADRDGARWRLVTSAGEVAASDVMIATDGYTDRAAPALQRRFVPVGSYMIATEPLREEIAGGLLPMRRMAFDSKHFLSYFRLSSDRRLLFGGRAELSLPDRAATRRAARVLARTMAEIFPQLASVRVEYAWGGRVAFTRDQMPRAGRLDGMYFAGGYCGHGIALATELGDLVGRRIAGEIVEHPLLDRDFPPIPFYRGTPWFLPIAGAWYRVMDWLS